jgi:hypothetical protein
MRARPGGTGLMAGPARDASYAVAEGYPACAQNAQWCAAAKSVSMCGWGGMSESICWLWLSKRGHRGWPAEDGKPRAVKCAQ